MKFAIAQGARRPMFCPLHRARASMTAIPPPPLVINHRPVSATVLRTPSTCSPLHPICYETLPVPADERKCHSGDHAASRWLPAVSLAAPAARARWVEPQLGHDPGVSAEKKFYRTRVLYNTIGHCSSSAIWI
jgi:hypothetical protein